MGNIKWSATSGALAGANGYIALEYILNYVSKKSAVFQAELAKAPELTERVYESAREAAERVSSGEIYSGLFSGTIAGFFAGIAVYQACKKDEE
jgi:hypothetical protein